MISHGILHITMVRMDITIHTMIITHITIHRTFTVDITIIMDIFMDGTTHTLSIQTIIYLDTEKIFLRGLGILPLNQT